MLSPVRCHQRPRFGPHKEGLCEARHALLGAAWAELAQNVALLLTKVFLENSWSLVVMLCNPRKLGLTPSLQTPARCWGGDARLSASPWPPWPVAGLALGTERGWRQLRPHRH